MTDVEQDQLSWVDEDAALVARLDTNWQGWRNPADGLVVSLDQESGWSGWRDWADDVKRTQLQLKLEEWYPRVAWVHDDKDLPKLLNKYWPEWNEAGADGLVALLDKQWGPDWGGWDDEAKRVALRLKMNEWYPARMAWAYEDQALIDRLWKDWADWEEPGEQGLLFFLDTDQDWEGWEDWSDDDKRSYLAESLDRWYPPAAGVAEPAEAAEAPEQAAEAPAPVPAQPANRLAWVSDQALVGRLNVEWAGWDDPGPDGLAAYLDQQPDWADWEAWSDGDKLSYLAESLVAWYGPAPVEKAAEQESAGVETEVETEEEAILDDFAAMIEEIPGIDQLSEDEIAKIIREAIGQREG